MQLLQLLYLALLAGLTLGGAMLPVGLSQVNHQDNQAPELANLTHVVKRWGPAPPCDDRTWTNAVCKGQRLLLMMAATDAQAGLLLTPPRSSAKSRFDRFPEDLTKWGWSIDRATYCDMDNNQYGIEAALAGMGVSSASSAWKCWLANHGDPYGQRQVHDQTYQLNGRTHRMTGAQYTTGFNVNDGVIMISKQYSPRTTGAQLPNPNTNDFPEIRKASDIVFGVWASKAGNRIQNVRFMVVWSAVNIETASIIRRALDSVGQPLNNYPGYSFDMLGQQGQAILGSPLGAQVGFFLGTHKPQLGQKAVYYVSVFAHTSMLMSREPVLVFYIQ